MSFFNSSSKIALIIAVLLALFFNLTTMNDMPMHIHAWAQSDRFALALNFLWNNFDILDAETYLMNLEFPSNFKKPKLNSVTMVNLPIHEYIIAIIMKLTGSREPIIFRTYMLIWSIVGLFYVSKIAQLFKLNKWSVAVLTIFCATSPVFIYYQNNFLPSIPSLALSFVGLYYYFKYFFSKSNKYFTLCVLFFGIAAIYRTTFIIPFIAILGVEAIQIIKRKSKVKPKLLPLLLLGLAFFLQRLHHLEQIHGEGSVFLYYLVPATSWTEFKFIISKAIDHWKLDYLNLSQYALFIFLLLLFFFKRKLSSTESNALLIFLPLISLLGIVLFGIAMATKFPDHDYYFLDTFYIPITLFLILVIYNFQAIIKDIRFSNFIRPALFLLFTASTIYFSKNKVDERRTNHPWDYSEEMAIDMADAGEVIDSLDIPRDAKILMFGNKYSNLPFLLMNRKGYTLNSTEKEDMLATLKWDFDYIVLHDLIYKEFYYHSFPEFLGLVKQVYSNGSFTICKLEKQKSIPKLLEFFKPDLSRLKYSQLVDFETTDIKYWSNINPSVKHTYDGEHSGFLEAKNEFGLTFKTQEIPLNDGQNHLINVTLMANATTTFKNLNLVVSATHEGNTLFYQSSTIGNIIKVDSGWNEISLQYQLPKVEDENVEIAVYIWNPGEHNFFYDNFKLEIY